MNMSFDTQRKFRWNPHCFGSHLSHFQTARVFFFVVVVLFFLVFCESVKTRRAKGFSNLMKARGSTCQGQRLQWVWYYFNILQLKNGIMFQGNSIEGLETFKTVYAMHAVCYRCSQIIDNYLLLQTMVCHQALYKAQLMFESSWNFFLWFIECVRILLRLRFKYSEIRC